MPRESRRSDRPDDDRADGTRRAPCPALPFVSAPRVFWFWCSSKPLEQIRLPLPPAIHQTEHAIELPCSPQPLLVRVGQRAEVFVDGHLGLMTLHCTPHGWPQITGINHRRDLPVGPG